MGDWAELAEERERIESAHRYYRGEPSEPGLVNPQVLNQDEFWWDAQGKEHRIDLMPYDYALNVLCFCYEHGLLADNFPGSKLQDRLYNLVREGLEYGAMYKDLCD